MREANTEVDVDCVYYSEYGSKNDYVINEDLIHSKKRR